MFSIPKQPLKLQTVRSIAGPPGLFSGPRSTSQKWSSCRDRSSLDSEEAIAWSTGPRASSRRRSAEVSKTYVLDAGALAKLRCEILRSQGVSAWRLAAIRRSETATTFSDSMSFVG